MAKRPAKAPESTPAVGFVPLKADGKRAGLLDVIGTEPVFAGAAGYSVGDRLVVTPQDHVWLPQALQASHNLFPGGVPNIWSRMLGDCMAHYFRDRLTEVEGTDERDVQDALRSIRATATKLKAQLDGPPSRDAAYSAAWQRIENTRHAHDDGRNLWGCLYPAMSLLTARLSALDSRSARSGNAPQSVKALVQRLAGYMAAHGIMAAGSNGIVRKNSDDTLSNLARLVKAIIVGSGLPVPGSMTDAALNKAVVAALKSR